MGLTPKPQRAPQSKSVPARSPQSQSLQDIVAELNRGPAAAPPAAPPAAKPPARRFRQLIPALLVLAVLALFGVLFRDLFRSSPPPPPVETPPVVAPPDVAPPAGIEIGGQVYPRVKLSELKLPADGKPLYLYCRLCAPLDRYTEENWIKADMLRDETGLTDPLLRTVTVKTQDALDNLVDWHVAAVAVRPGPAAPAP
jgi:hypothetical protein